MIKREHYISKIRGFYDSDLKKIITKDLQQHGANRWTNIWTYRNSKLVIMKMRETNRETSLFKS